MEERLLFVGVSLGLFAWRSRRWKERGGPVSPMQSALWHALFYAIAAFSIVMILTMIGFVCLILPGIYLAVACDGDLEIEHPAENWSYCVRRCAWAAGGICCGNRYCNVGCAFVSCQHIRGCGRSQNSYPVCFPLVAVCGSRVTTPSPRRSRQRTALFRCAADRRRNRIGWSD